MYILEKVNTACGWQLTPETAVVAEHISMHNWLYPNNLFKAVACGFSELDAAVLPRLEEERTIIPAGSVDFVNAVLKLQGIKPCTPVNIPDELNEKEFLNRKISRESSKIGILNFMDACGADEIFIKSDTELKAGFAGVYDRKADWPRDTRYFVSEVAYYVSEWRAFVFHGKLLGIKNYDGGEFKIPDRNFIEKCIAAMGDSLPAYTLDIGLEPDGRNSVIEVHEFFSCGLYGFDHPALLNMMNEAYRHRKAVEKYC